MSNKKKIVFLSLIASLLLVGGYILGTTNVANEVSIATEDEIGSTISVSGEGVVKITPDVAYINIGVETENKYSDKAQSENATKMDRVIKKIKEQGINNEDIKTIEYNIITNRVYNRDTNKNEIKGYIVRNVFEVTVNNIDNIGKIIDTVSIEGANQINNIRFGTNKREEYYLEALKMAMKNSENKAKAIAETFGVKLDEPYKVMENSLSSYPITFNYEFSKSMEDGSAYQTPISGGDLQIKASVSSVYKY